MGIWPQVNPTGIKKYTALIHVCLCLIFLMIPRLIAVFLLVNEPEALIHGLSSYIPISLGFSKLLMLHIHQKVICELLKEMERDWLSPMSEMEFNRLIKFAQISRWISIVSSLVAYVTTSVGAIAQKIYSLEGDYIKNPDPRLAMNLFWIVYLPYDTDKIIYYIFSLAMQFYASCVCALLYFTFDNFINMIILNLCGQLGLIEISLSQLNYNNEIGKISNFQVKIKKIVQRHVKLIRLTQNLNDAFNLLYLLSLIGFTLTVCFTGYTVIKISGSGELNLFQIGFAISITIGVGIQFFCSCLFGNILITQSLAVGQAYYQSNWTHLKPRESQNLLLIGFKMFRPLELTTGKFATLSLRLFLNAVKTSLSYLSVLMAVQTTSSQ